MKWTENILGVLTLPWEERVLSESLLNKYPPRGITDHF